MATDAKNGNPLEIRQTYCEPTVDPEKYRHGLDPKRFSGECFGIVYRPHNGFKNYMVVRLAIDKGSVKVVGTEVKGGAGLNAEEAIGWLEISNTRLMDKLQREYPTDEKGESYRVA